MRVLGSHRLSLEQYGQYMAIAALVGVLTVACRELIALCLPQDTRIYYLISVLGAYGFGIALNFILQRMITFGKQARNKTRQYFLPFFIVALAGMGLVSLLALLLRYFFWFNLLFGAFSPSVAFTVAVIISSIFTYTMNTHVVFQK